MELEKANGVAIGSLLAQPKRLALLAYLASASPRGFHPREKVLALFWPDHDSERARGALNTTVYRLRRSLGPDVLLTRGTGEIGLDRERLRCDVVAFEEALDNGRLEDALALYRGEFLPGLVVPDAVEWERWHERERKRLRERAGEAALELAERAAAADDPTTTAERARRALEIAPYDEAALRLLVRALARSGSRPRALREYEGFARRLREDVGLEASAETLVLIEAIRAEAPGAATAAPGAATDPALAPEPARAVGAPRPPPASAPWWRRPRAPAVAALVIAASAASLALWSPIDGGYGPDDGAESDHLSGVTASEPALRAYLEGRRALRAGDYDEAMTALRRAIAEDTTFALAYFDLSNAAMWLDASEVADHARVQALRYADRLPRPQRRLLRAMELHWGGEPAEAERVYRDVLARSPELTEAWYQLGELLFHWGAMIGRPLTEAREAFVQVLAVEPENVNALVHLARIAGSLGDAAAVDTLTPRILELDPSWDRSLTMTMIQALVTRDEDAAVALRRQAESANNERLAGLVASAVAHTDHPAAAAGLAHHLLLPRRPEVWNMLLLYIAELEAAQGRWGAADETLRILDSRNAERGAEYRAALASLPFLSVPHDDLETILETFPRPTGDVEITAWIDFLNARRVYLPRALYALALLEIRLGHETPALSLIEELESFDRGIPRDQAFAAGYARTLRAEIARAQGDPARALAWLGEPRVPPDHLFPSVLSYPLAHARWLRAELLRELGRDRDALHWYATFPSPQAYDAMYVAAARLRRARIHERLGEPDYAAHHYAGALRLWTDSDSALAPLVQQAREGLARIQD